MKPLAPLPKPARHGLAALVAAFLVAPPPASATLTNAQLAGQHVIFGYAGTTPPRALKDRIRRGEAAGVILYGGNIASRRQLAATVRKLQAIPRPAGLSAPLLIMLDQEGGRVKRLAGPPTLSPAQMGRATVERVRAEGEATGRSLRGVGVNVNLAPVLDLGRRGSYATRIGRAFTTRPARVTRTARAFVQGLRTAGVLACAKHFPGLGFASRDEDRAINRVRAGRAVLRRQDEAPFAALASSVPLVMTSTPVYEAFGPLPALISNVLLGDELRGRLGFRGVTISDDLDVPALASWGSPPALGIRAARAGNDLLLFATGYTSGDRGARALARALARRQVTRAALKSSLTRVLALRAAAVRSPSRKVGGGTRAASRPGE